jgi:hypothetical protein
MLLCCAVITTSPQRRGRNRSSCCPGAGKQTGIALRPQPSHLGRDDTASCVRSSSVSAPVGAGMLAAIDRRRGTEKITPNRRPARRSRGSPGVSRVGARECRDRHPENAVPSRREDRGGCPCRSMRSAVAPCCARAFSPDREPWRRAHGQGGPWPATPPICGSIGGALRIGRGGRSRSAISIAGMSRI